MSKLIIDSGTLTSIGDAIREKTGKQDLLSPAQMATEISNISVGGGGGSEADQMLDDLISGDNLGNVYERYYNDKITTIRKFAFCKDENYGTRAITINEFDLPNVESVQGYAFAGSKASKYNLPKVHTVQNWAFSYNENLTEIKLPKVCSMSTATFYHCDKLTKLDIGGQGIRVDTEIYGANITNACPILETIILRWDNCPSLSSANAFRGPIEAGTGYIYVPSSLIEKYRSATNWSRYTYRAIEDYPEICG